MSSVQNLRELINERLTAAAEEIFTEFEKTIVQYEEEIDRQRRLLDNMWKAEIKFHTTDKYFYDLKMNSVQNLRELINERLTAAAEEIFTVFEKTIVQYEEEIDRQRRLLDNTWKAEIKIQTTDLLQQHVQEENVLAEQNLCNQEKNSSVDQDDPDAPQKNEEQEELCTSGEGEHLALIQEANSLVQCKSNCAEISREIFGVSDKPLGQLDEEIDYEPRLVDAIWKPRIMLHRIDHPHQDVWKERNGLAHQQLCNQEKKFSLDQEHPTPPEIKEEEEKFSTFLDQKDPETPQIKEEQNDFCTSLDQEDPEPSQITEESEELCTSQQKQQIVLNQGTDTFLLTSADKDGDHSELEPNSNQLLSSNSPVAESPHEEGTKHVDSGSTRNAALKAKKSHNRESSHSNNVDKSSLSGSHCDTDTGRKSLKCDVCGKTFQNKYQMKKRHQVHNSVKPNADNACRKKFNLRSDLKVRTITDKGDKQFSCETCGKCFSKSCYLTVHMRTHTSKKPFSCKTCGKGFIQNISLTNHMRTHTGEKPYTCETCGKRFHQSHHLTAHMRTHTGETSTEASCCDRCGKKFNRRSRLHVHRKNHTGEKPYSCERCGKSFCFPYHLTVHMRTHTGERPYSCERCGKSFCFPHHLTVHMRTHTGERPYSCKTCGKSFSISTHLSVHMRTHTGEKPYSCETCGKSFSKRNNLTVHMRTHTGERPYSCERCGKSFIERSKLTTHMRVHTGERPYSCETCGKSFIERSKLTVHMRTHTGKRPYSCETWKKFQRTLAADCI
ncbi:zinc finger protein ZFP2-like isoform X7 [Acanthochromis polyacanthus]|uniref:zinc finger protein ZFP2-like isoform X7 n=1 Tax=Acanthochromis polyacanthus TaxID=80966 RepID=UPI0022349044|nr:zinc finger protein ZFP2-like isoform X7 [Acanthochromis polyacanthus]